MGKDIDAQIHHQPPEDQKEEMLSGKHHKKEVVLDSQIHSADDGSVEILCISFLLTVLRSY